MAARMGGAVPVNMGTLGGVGPDYLQPEFLRQCALDPMFFSQLASASVTPSLPLPPLECACVKRVRL